MLDESQSFETVEVVQNLSKFQNQSIKIKEYIVN